MIKALHYYILKYNSNYNKYYSDKSYCRSRVFISGVKSVYSASGAIEFLWPSDTDHRTVLHGRDAHDNRSFCLAAIGI